jgi:predicted nucleic acid-binding protein
MKYVVDTNILNRLLDGKLRREDLPAPLVATHLQSDEINETSDKKRRGHLAITLATSIAEWLPTETTICDVSRFDLSKLGDGVLYEKILAALDARNGGRASNMSDALTAEVAIANGYTLVTADGDLADVTRELGGLVHQVK